MLSKEDRYTLAKSLFLKGYNCAQAVTLSFDDVLSLDEDTLLKLSSSFGGGIARLRETCGAVSGIAIVLGLLYGYNFNDNDKAKEEHYKRVQQVVRKFEDKFKSLNCATLLGKKGHDDPSPTPRTQSFYLERPCGEFIGYAAYLIQEYIDSTK